MTRAPHTGPVKGVASAVGACQSPSRVSGRGARGRRDGGCATRFDAWEMADEFGAPTLDHYRRVYAAYGAPWPGDDEVRRHLPVAVAS